MDMQFDLNALMDQMKDYAILGFISAQIDNEKDRKFITDAMKLFMDYGVPADKAFEILGKLSKLTDEYND